jgi:uncharacterized RDD family membrane protein YckC
MASTPVATEIFIEPQPPSTQPISGFWRRLAAFLIDGVLLGIAGTIVGLAFFEQLAALGWKGELVGLLVSVPYFGLLNSSLGGGQTFGKRLLAIRVVDKRGDLIPPIRSLARSFVFLLPFALNGMAIGNLEPGSPTGITVLALQSIIIFGLGGGLLYFAIFNRSTRQSVHDLLLGTYVVRSGNAGAVVALPMWKWHWAALCGILAAATISGAVVFKKLAGTPMFGEFVAIQKAVQDTGRYEGVSVMKGAMYSTNGNYTYLTVTARVHQRTDLKQEVDTLAATVLRDHPNAMGTDRLFVVVTYGYDLGFANSWRSYRDGMTPNDWRERLAGNQSHQ